MIEEFISEINEKKDFNNLLKEIVNLTKIGCIIIYLFFIISIIIFPLSIKITIWITIIGWFLLIMTSNNYFLYEKEVFFNENKSKRVINDIKFIKLMLNKYNLEDNILDIVKYIETKKEKKRRINWFTLVMPITAIVLFFSNVIDLKTKITYMIIISIFTIFMNHFGNYLDNGIHSKEQCNYNYIIFCLNEIKLEKLT